MAEVQAGIDRRTKRLYWPFWESIAGTPQTHGDGASVLLLIAEPTWGTADTSVRCQQLKFTPNERAIMARRSFASWLPIF